MGFLRHIARKANLDFFILLLRDNEGIRAHCWCFVNMLHLDSLCFISLLGILLFLYEKNEFLRAIFRKAI